MRKFMRQIRCKIRTGHRETYTEFFVFGSKTSCFSCGKVF